MSDEKLTGYLRHALFWGGLMVAAFWASTWQFENFAGAEVASHPLFIPGQILHTLGALLVIFGYIGLFIRIRKNTSAFAFIAFLIATLGAIFFFGDGIIALMIFPVVAENEPTLLAATGPFFTGYVLNFYIAFAATHMIGIVLFSVAMIRSRSLPVLAIVLFMAGGIVANLPPVPGLHLLLVAGGIGYGVALAWLGSSLSFQKA